MEGFVYGSVEHEGDERTSGREVENLACDIVDE